MRRCVEALLAADWPSLLVCTSVLGGLWVHVWHDDSGHSILLAVIAVLGDSV